MRRGLAALAQVEGTSTPSVVASLADIAPDLANMTISFAYGEVYVRPELDFQQRQLITIAVLATMGGLEPQLKFHIKGAINVGCSPAQVVELMTHLVIYAGFPAALNGIATARTAFLELSVKPSRNASAIAARTEDRFAAGMEALRNVDGHLGEKVIASLADIAPDLGRFIVEFAFGDIYTRPGMDLISRELVTVASLVALGSATAQLKVHMNGFLNVGGSVDQMVGCVLQTAVYAGFPRAINGALVAKEVVSERATAALTVDGTRAS
ncbi:MAG: carboxymuconolactone decarboxylase family protein [Pseudomonadota bacterium]|nr:carboxymuconolactone decarboxylase family protein [Pseudomonadota bacterium]